MIGKREVFGKYQLQRVINAAGTVTPIGAAPVKGEVIHEVSAIVGENIRMEQLQQRAGALISKATGAEWGCVTACSAAGIAVAIAACMTGNDLSKVEQLPDTTGFKNEVIIQKGHVINTGGSPVNQLIRITGARPIEIGLANGTSPYHLKGAINDRTAAILYIVAEATVNHRFLSLPTIVEVAKATGVPVIVDAAAEHDLQGYIEAGADLVIYSGHKYLQALTSGMLCGSRELISACLAQEAGIGRCMKVGKEGLIGLMAALSEKRPDLGKDRENASKKAENLIARFRQLPGVKALTVDDPRGNPLIRVHLRFDHSTIGMRASEVVERVSDAEIHIKVREAYDDRHEGIIVIEPRYLSDDDQEILVERFMKVLG